MALSQSLPLSPAPFDDHQCRAYFAGLLPEGKLRRLIAQQCHVSHQNDFALLNAIGGECAGAITFVPLDIAVHAPEQAGIEWLDEQEITNLLDELPHRRETPRALSIRLAREKAERAREMRPDQVLVVNLSGRGDKDVQQVQRMLG